METLSTAHLRGRFPDSDESLWSKYLAYLKLLTKWNTVYNLTSLKTSEEMLQRHVFDSLSILPFIKGANCLDIGTGAGLPGIILALAQPERHWILLDSNQRKVCFLRHVKASLAIDNIKIVGSRIEVFEPNAAFDTMVCRAFAPLERILALTAHLFTDNNQLLAMKGKQVDKEIATLKQRDFLIELKRTPLINDNGSSLVKIKHKEGDMSVWQT